MLSPVVEWPREVVKMPKLRNFGGWRARCTHKLTLIYVFKLRRRPPPPPPRKSLFLATPLVSQEVPEEIPSAANINIQILGAEAGLFRHCGGFRQSVSKDSLLTPRRAPLHPRPLPLRRVPANIIHLMRSCHYPNQILGKVV